MKEYDVVGACTAGTYFSNLLAKEGLKVQRDLDNYLAPWVIDDEEGKIHIEFTPIYDNYTENKYVVINTHCNQVFGYYSGYIMVDEKKIEFNDILAFIEHAVNKW